MKITFTKLLSNLMIPVAFLLIMGSSLQAQWVLEVDIDGEVDQFAVGLADFGPRTADTISGPAIIGMDGSNNPRLGCEPLTTDLSGAFGILNRGECEFKRKAINAQNAGAIGLIVCNTLDELLNMPDAAGIPDEVNIQSVILTNSDCRTIRMAIDEGSEVNVSLFEIPLNVVWGGEDEPNSTFDGGLNDWTTGGPNADLWFHSMPIASTPVPPGWRQDASPNSHYDYSLNPNLDKFPRFYGTTTDRRIISNTVENGFAMIDMDSWNNTDGGDGAFTDNTPNAELISPVIDLSGFEEQGLALTFSQSTRLCCDGDTELIVQVSTDGFQSFSSFDVRDGQDLNAIDRDRRVTINLSDALADAADLSNFQIKFVYNSGSSHYFWMIDDVEIIELPAVNLEISDSQFPATAVCIPEAYIKDQEFEFAFAVANRGGADQDLIEGSVRVTNAATDEVLLTQTETISDFVRGTDTVFFFSETYVPSDLEIGTYIVTYSVRTPGAVDFDPSTNVVSYFFSVTDDIYANEDCSRTENLPALRATNVFTWYWGNAYYIGDLGDGDRKAVLDGVQGSVFLQGDSEWTTQELYMHVLKFREPGPEAFNNFDSDFPDDPTFHPDLEPIALGVISSELLNETGNGNIFELSWEDFFLLDGTFPDGPIELDQNHYYFFFLQIDEDGQEPFIFVGNNPGNIRTSPFRELLFASNGYSLFQVSSRRPVIRLRTSAVGTSVDGDIVEQTPMMIYPVPANNELNIDLNQNVNGNVNLEFYDTQGRLISNSVHLNSGSGTINADVSEFTSGNYILRVVTDNGVTTQQVIIVR